MNNKIVFYLTIFVLLVSNLVSIFYIYKLQSKIKSLKETQTTSLENISLKNEYLEFLSFFIKKILKAEKEVDFETRLELENKIRDLNDKEVLNLWNKFINSQNENEAQTNLKSFLEILVDKSLIK